VPLAEILLIGGGLVRARMMPLCCFVAPVPTESSSVHMPVFILQKTGKEGVDAQDLSQVGSI